MSILVYFRACPLTSILSPEGERKFRRTRNPERQRRLAIWFISVRAPSPQSSPRGGEEVQADAQSGEATTISNLVYFCACPLTSILSPKGERKFGRTRNPERQ